MQWYINFVIQYPILTAMVQFAVLKLLGDMILKWVIEKESIFLLPS